MGTFPPHSGEVPACSPFHSVHSGVCARRKLHVEELPAVPGDGFSLVNVDTDLPMHLVEPDDLALGMHIGEKHSVLFAFTRSGFFLLFDVVAATLLVRQTRQLLTW